jgi:hypothetical protein
MDRAGTDESHQVEMTLVFFGMLHAFEQDRVLEEAPILDSERDTRHVLIDDPTGTHGHMTHFAVARGIPRQTYGDTGGLEGSHGVKTVQFLESREGCLTDRVSLDAIGESPAIEYDEYERFIHCVLSIYFVFQYCCIFYTIIFFLLTKGKMEIIMGIQHLNSE